MNNIEFAKQIRKEGKLLFSVDFLDGIHWEYYLYYGSFFWVEVSNWQRDKNGTPITAEIPIEELLDDFAEYWNNEKVNLKLGCE